MKRREFIVDTNVLLVASELSDMSLDCREKCVRFIHENIGTAIFVIDQEFEILGEYHHQLNPRGNRLGDMFLRHLLTQRYNKAKVKNVPITKIQEYEYEEFPDSLQEKEIDNSDKKFIALANSNKGKAPIVQASDSKWIGWAAALKQEKIFVEFTCREELAEIFIRKMG
jgi:hypothetical protein